MRYTRAASASVEYLGYSTILSGKRSMMNRFWFLMISLILFVIGLFILLKSVSWGHQAANDYLLSQGGGMDTAQFILLLEEFISAYRWSGSILSLISGLGLVKAMELK